MRLRGGGISAQAERDHRVEHRQDLAQLTRRREVFGLFDHEDALDAVRRRQRRDDLLHQVLGRARARSDTDDAGLGERREIELLRRIHAQDALAAGVSGDLDERHRVRGILAADDDDRVGAARDLPKRGLPVRGRVAEVVARRRPQLGKAFASTLGDALPVLERQRRLREQRDLGRVRD